MKVIVVVIIVVVIVIVVVVVVIVVVKPYTLWKVERMSELKEAGLQNIAGLDRRTHNTCH